jgi:hypothetical protein
LQYEAAESAPVGRRSVFNWAIATAQDSATAQEVLQKTREAADYLVREGAKGVATFKSKNPQSFWKSDGYIFIIDCELGRMLANANLALAGAPLKRPIRSASILRNPYAKMVAVPMAAGLKSINQNRTPPRFCARCSTFDLSQERPTKWDRGFMMTR